MHAYNNVFISLWLMGMHKSINKRSRTFLWIDMGFWFVGS